MLIGRAAIVLTVVLAGFYGIAMGGMYLFSPRGYYSEVYGTPLQNVTIADKPRDCQFDWSPLGVKGCHYEKVVSVFKDSDGQRLVVVGWNRQTDAGQR